MDNEKETTEKSVDLLPETLQVGDYIPFIEINGEGRKKHMHNYCNNSPFMFVTIKNLNDEDLHEIFVSLSNNFNVIVLFEQGEPVNSRTNILYTKDVQLKNILMMGDKPQVYITSPNRRIISIMDSDELREMKEFKIEDYLPKEVHIPYLLIENALDDNLLKKVIDFYNQKKVEGKLTSHQYTTKNRLHVHPDVELEKEIDHKLSRSVLPELRKVFYFDAQYRESYKICSYDAETSGRFHPHRDTPSPYQHRKYALSLFLNDDYEGGEFVLPEYGLKVKPKANTAFIFPGISTHQVLPVTKGSRMTIISFFVNGSIRPQYKMKAHYYKDKNIVDSDIYPL
jgi:predicted 2-oxoglutarate/Fe(II)-dependent dioxygenase YbiX